MTDHELKANGRSYPPIPDIWLAGFCTANRCTVDEAVRYWIWQCDLEESAS